MGAILHADMDAFYASVEQRDRPELRGLPVIVGGTSDRGVVSAASYEARRFGVHSAMPTAQARKLCPHGVFLRGDMSRYVCESRRIFAIFGRFTPRVEGISLDEAFLDLGGTERLLGPPREVGRKLREAVRREVDLAVSVGIGPVKMVAKIASDLAKPDGLLEVAPDAVGAFLDPLPAGRLWGVGPVAARRLEALGIHSIGDLARADEDGLRRELGSFGPAVADLARGRDLREVAPYREPVSYSEENTFARDVLARDVLATTIAAHAEAVARRLRRDGLAARTVVLKLKLGRRRAAGPRGFPLLTRRATRAEPTDDGAAIAAVARQLLDRAGPPEPVRLVGVGVTNLCVAGPAQIELFGAGEGGRHGQLNRALDEIAERFGPDAIVRGAVGGRERAGLSLQIKRGEEPRDAPAARERRPRS
jgi:DNA polymerase-4